MSRGYMDIPVEALSDLIFHSLNCAGKPIDVAITAAEILDNGYLRFSVEGDCIPKDERIAITISRDELPIGRSRPMVNSVAVRVVNTNTYIAGQHPSDFYRSVKPSFL
jgi:hypothetical protein